MFPRPTAAAVLFAASLAATAAAQPATPTLQERLGHPADSRLLIIHGDDLGMAHSVNQAIFEALEKGWITSASILVPCPWFPEAAAWAKRHPDLDLGIHLDLNSEWTGFRWGPVSGRDVVPSLLDPDGYFPLVEPTVVEHARPEEVERELTAQIEKARAAGIRISHLDAHMGTLFDSPALFEVYLRLGARYHLPQLIEKSGERRNAWPPEAEQRALIDQVVSLSPGVPADGWLEAYEKLLAPLQPGVYQLIVHLAHDDEELQGATAGHPDWGAAWRQHDFDLVGSAAFREFLKQQGFVLINWGDLARVQP